MSSTFSEKSKAQISKNRAILLLYAALILKALSIIIPAFTFPSSVAFALFFIAEISVLAPAGMAVMCLLVSVICALAPFIITMVISLLVESVVLVFLGGLLAIALAGFFITSINGTLLIFFGIPLAPIYAAGTAGFTAAGAGAAIGAAGVSAAGSAIDYAALNARRMRRRKFTLICNALILVCIGWPLLSYTTAFTGALACKPAVTLNQHHINKSNIIASREYKKMFKHEQNWTFTNGFYEKSINNDCNNIALGNENRIASSENSFALLLNGLIYKNSNDVSDLYGVYGYIPEKTDAMVMNDGLIYVFGHNKVFVCGESGTYTWKDTKWTSDFEKLSTSEQFDLIYDILERQNTTQNQKFSYEEVGVIAYAQRNGILLDYESDTGYAYMASKEKDGTVTLYGQSAPNTREELASFKPTYNTNGLPYVMTGEKDVLFIRGDQIVCLYCYGAGWMEHISQGNRNESNYDSIIFSNAPADGEYSIYTDPVETLVDLRAIGINTLVPTGLSNKHIKAFGVAGGYFYCIEYKDNIISRLTYLTDLRRDDAFSVDSSFSSYKIWTEDWNYHRMKLTKGTFERWR